MQKSGYTLIELLLFMGILAIFLAVLTQIFTSTLDVQLESSNNSSVDQAKAFLLSRLQYDIHRSTSIVTPASPGQSSSTLVLNIGGVATTYQVINNQFTITNNQGTDILSDVTTQASNFQVTRIGNGTSNDTVEITLTLTSTTQSSAGIAETRQLNTTYSLR
jgi:type II secretory pathway pseudopilin PulG